jgi:lactose/L-arabinose transport system substrate-binding protein
VILSPRLSALLACAALALAAGACGGTDDESSNGSTSGGEAAEPATGVQAELNAACKADPADPAGTAPAEGDPNLKGTVTMWGWYNVPPEAVYKEFKKLYPNVTVKFSQFGLPETHQKLRNAVQGGTGAPDISMVEDRRGPQFWDGGLLNLDECVKPVAGAFPESKIEKVTTPAGNMQAVPWESGPVVISYRRSVFEEYGIDPESIETWDDYIAAGKQIAERSGGKVKMLISQKLPVDGTSFPGATNLFQAFTQQQGGPGTTTPRSASRPSTIPSPWRL